MSAPTTTVPIVIMPDAAERVAELGIQAEVQEMIEHARQTVPGLREIRLILEPSYDTAPHPYLTIEAICEPGTLENFDRSERWDRWQISRFPPEVNQHITLLVFDGPNHAG